MRMIDADVLTKTIAGKIAEFETIDDCTAETLRKCKAIIEKQPTIDAEGRKQYQSFCTREQMVVFLKRLAELEG